MLYVAVAAVVTGIVPSAQFANISHPVSYALQVAGQNWVAGFIDLGAVLGMLTVILVMSYGQTRVIYAMSRDGLLPARLSKLHPRFATPFFTTWLVGIFFGLIGALVPLNVLAELINIGTLAAFCMVSIAVLILRKHASRTAARVPLPGRAGRAGAGGGFVSLPDDQSSGDDVDRVRGMARDRAGHLLRLRARELQSGSRHSQLTPEVS